MISRPYFHFTPPHMWLNDPNGMVYYQGEYHLFYQYHPESTVWGPMHWGHAISHDLVNWEHLPIALYPDENGMIFSGSAVVDWNNTAGFGREALVAIFTYNRDYKESQNLAFSTDNGRTWTKYSGNPVIPHPVPVGDFRDPKVFWHHDHWVMLLAAKDAILFYTSPDLKTWTKSGYFGGGYGSMEGVWETPELFKLFAGDESRWVLTVGVGDGGPASGSGTQYFVGSFDGLNFTSENPKETVLWTDFGGDYYAPQSWNEEPGGRRLMLGWMSNWQYARLIPESGWRGTFSLIREMFLVKTAQGFRLAQKPAPELQTLRAQHLRWTSLPILPGGSPLGEVNALAFEILARFQVTERSGNFGVRVRVGKDEFTTLRYLPAQKTLQLDRSHSGAVSFHESFGAVHSAALTPEGGIVELHILVDVSSIEVFANQGQVTFCDCIFPSEESQGVEVFAETGETTLLSLDLYHLNRAKFIGIQTNP